jgi:mannose-6-phosphate isomerase
MGRTSCLDRPSPCVDRETLNGRIRREAALTIEHAVVREKLKPWGTSDLLPWSKISTSAGPIGELWFERADVSAPETALLFKLLFTTEPLSIQVHPDDAFARSIGLSSGKTEAWYILSAIAGAVVAVGLKHPLSSAELRTAIADGSIADIVHWHPVRLGDVIFVPAGTIHAIGAGIVLAEIQQRSDATFRLFDYSRQRELHVDLAVAAAMAGPAERQLPPEQLNDARKALVVNPHFILELVDLVPDSVWTLDAPNETWILVIAGHAQMGSTKLSLGEVVFLEADHAAIEAGADGLRALLAYLGPNVNRDALKARRANGAATASRASSRAPALPVPFEHSTLNQSEMPTWPS